MKVLFKLFLFVSLIFNLLGVIFAGSILDVSLSNQDPNPVSPGNFVYLYLKVSNSGDTQLDNVIVSFKDSEIFTLADGEKRTRDLGIIPPFSNLEGSRAYQLERFKVLISDDAPIGLNRVYFEVLSNGEQKEYSFDVMVEDDNPSIILNVLESSFLKPGEKGVLNLEIKNVNSIPLRNVEVKLDLESVENSAINLISDSNVFYIPILDSDASNSLKYEILISPDALSKPYNLPVIFNFEDSLGNNFSKKLIVSIPVYSNPELKVNLDSQELFSVNEKSGKVSFAVANPGVSVIKGTEIILKETEDYRVLSGSYNYVGDLNPDDFQTIQSEIVLLSSDKRRVNLTLEISYLDSYNKEFREEINVPINFYDSSDLEILGMNGSSSFSFSYIFIFILGFFIGLFFYRRRLIKRNKHK